MSIVVCPFKGASLLCKPTNENTSTSSGVLVNMVYLPFTSVTTPVDVFFTNTLTPGIGVLSSSAVTVPVTRILPATLSDAVVLDAVACRNPCAVGGNARGYTCAIYSCAGRVGHSGGSCALIVFVQHDVNRLATVYRRQRRLISTQGENERVGRR